MHLEHIRIEGFGNLTDREFAFSPGLNLVLGPNEAGKTTLIECLAAIPYGLRSLKGERERWRPWKHQAYAAELKLKLADASTVTIRRDFDSNKADYVHVDADGRTLEELSELKATPAGRTPEARTFHERIQALFGIVTGDAFRQFICVSFQDLSNLGGKSLGLLVRQAVTGGQVDYERVGESLKSQVDQITREFMSGRPSDKILEKLYARREELQKRVQASETDYQELVRLRTEMARISERVDSLKQQHSQLQDTLDKIEAYRRCQGEMAYWTQKRDTLNSQCRTLESIGGKRADLDNNYRDVQSLPEDFEKRLSVTQRSEAKAEGLSRGYVEQERHIKSMQVAPVWKRPGVLALFGIALLVGVVLVALKYWQVGIALFAFVVMGFAFALWQSLTQKAARQATNQRLEELRRELDGARAELEGHLDEIRRFLPTFVLDEAEETLGRWRNCLRLKQDIELLGERVEKGLALSTARKQLKEAEEQVGTLALAKQKMETEAGFLRTVSTDFEEDKRLSLEVCQRDLRQAEAKLRETERQQLELSLRTENVELLTEELDELNLEISHHEFQRDAYKLALDTWQECVEEFRSNYVPHFAQVVSRHLRPVTLGKYERMKFDSELAPLVEGPEGAEIEEDSLSQGTRDELYFVIRLALIELFSRQQEPLPLLLDDPFLTFDAARKAEALAAVARIAEANQVIILSLDESLRECGATVLDLEA